MESNDKMIDVTGYGSENDILLPEGYKEGMTLESLAASMAGTADGQDPALESQTDATEQESVQTGSESDAPTLGGKDTIPESGGDNQRDGEAAPKAASDETPIQNAPTPRILKLRVDRQDRDFNVTGASDEQLADLIQKGMAWDNRVETDNKRTYREVYRRLSEDDGYPPELAAVAAFHAAGGKAYSLTDEQETPSAVSPTAPPQNAPDYSAELAQLRQEIAALKKSNAELAAAKQEVKLLRQQKEAAQKAPVRGVTGGGAKQIGKKTPVDIMMEGFDKDNW